MGCFSSFITSYSGLLQLFISLLSLQCESADIRISSLLKAACNEDFPPLKPRFKEYDGYPDIFFINKSKDIIFFIYDDRGYEIIAKEPAALDMSTSQLSNYTYDKKTGDL